MEAVTYSEARNNLAHYLDRVVDDVDATIITRQRGEPAVLMSLREYEQWQETLHLLGRGNAKRLLTAVDDVAASRKRVRTRELVDE
jgi:antitoxin YefM